MTTQRIDLPQGTLDSPFSERCPWARNLGGRSPSAFSRFPTTFYAFSKALSIRLFIAWAAGMDQSEMGRIGEQSAR